MCGILAYIGKEDFSSKKTSELLKLMKYTESSVETKGMTRFLGSHIEEFDQIGSSFEASFQRFHEQEKQSSQTHSVGLQSL